MEGGGRSRLSRLLNKLRGDHHKYSLDKGISFTSTAMSESIGCGSTTKQFEDEEPPFAQDLPFSGQDEPVFGRDDTASAHATSSVDDEQFAANIDLRYGGQYLTPEQLPAFCQQLHHLVHVIRNIQSYAKVTGEYPIELERGVEREAREVSALAAETRNACDVAARCVAQRRALRRHRAALEAQLATYRDAETVELESKVRLSDRKLFKSWESVRDSTDPAAFDSLLSEIRTKQSALLCLVRLIEARRAVVAKSVHPLPQSSTNENEESSAMSGRKRHETRRNANKRRRKEARSVPLSSEPSAHAHPAQVRLYISSAESAPAPAPLALPSGGSVRDILFFTTNTSRI